MTMCAFPRKQYDEIDSEFIRGEIRKGSFEDIDYRRYVNQLVDHEWHMIDSKDLNITGISGFGWSISRWKLAAVRPEAYDAIQRDLDLPTRAEQEWTWSGEEDIQDRQRWSRRHSEEWQAVQRGEQRSPEARLEFDKRGSRSFAPFRFPVLPYDSIQSSFIREEICRNSFDDLSQRRMVNKFAWIEWYTTEHWKGGAMFPPTPKNWRLAAEYPMEFDIIRRELSEETRDSIELSGNIYCGEDVDIEATARKHKLAWQTVQEAEKQ